MMTHDRLVENLGDGEYGPMLAIDWRTTDWQTFVFYLRDDVYFHNGDHFTADCVVFNITMSRRYPGTLGFDRWRTVETVTALDTYVVEIVLEQMHVDFLFDISTAPAGIVNERAYNEDSENPEWAWIGTGPFLITDFATNDYVTLQRFDNFWGEAPPTQSVTLRHIPEPAARLVMMQNRESDVSFGTTPEDLEILQADPDFQVIPALFNAPNVLGFNMKDPLMSDRNFRMVVMHALNLEEIAIVAAGEWAIAPVDGNLWGYATEFRHPGIPRIPFDLELAKQYLDASPYNGEEIEITAAVATNIRAAEIIQHQLGQIGLNTTINATDVPGLVTHLAYGEDSTAQIHLFASGFTMGAIGSATNVFFPGTGSNRLNFNDPYVTDIIQRARVTGDVEERRALFMHLQEYIAADPPQINMFWRVNGIAAINGIGGMHIGYDTLSYNFRNIFKIIDY